MPLTVLSVAYSFAPVGVGAVGGAEQILTVLDRALTKAGHTSLVVACEGSMSAGKLYSLPFACSNLKNEREQRQVRKQFQAVLDAVLSTRRVDLIHMHGFDFHEYRLPSDVPVLVTLHLPIDWYPDRIWREFTDNVRFQCVSKSQRQSCPVELCNSPVIVNGVELSACEEKKGAGNFAMALGRICPEKNQHAALEAGFLAGTPVLLGGQVFSWPEHRKYFREKVKPLLRQKHDTVRHTFCGPLAPKRKQRLLAQAKCLLHPTLAPETSSLVGMEALAAGIPVIAYRSGALPEIVEDGVTGFLVDGVEEMAEAIHHVHVIRPEACRAAAEQRFSQARMIEQYFHLYQEMIRTPLRRRANV